MKCSSNQCDGLSYPSHVVLLLLPMQCEHVATCLVMDRWWPVSSRVTSKPAGDTCITVAPMCSEDQPGLAQPGSCSDGFICLQQYSCWLMAVAGLTVHMYHGKQRLTQPEQLARYGVVLTTFTTMSMEAPPRADKAEAGSGGEAWASDKEHAFCTVVLH